jgi:hypothetical protein
MKPVCGGLFWFHSKLPKLYTWPTNGKEVVLRKPVLRTVVRMCSSECRDLERGYIILSMNKDSKVQYNNGPAATRRFRTVVHTCGERIEVGGVK